MKNLHLSSTGFKMFFPGVLFTFLFQICNPPPPPPPPTAEKEIGSIRIYIDNSAGMNGFFKGDTEFKTIISDFAVKVEKNLKPVEIYFSSESDIKYSGDAQKFSSDIATTTFADNNGYPLHDMLKRYAELNDSCDVSILISDCILSFPDEQIRKIKEINRIEAPNSLKNNIYSTSADLKRKGYGISIYAFKSKFHGRYYAYDNSNSLLPSDEFRPFYILVFADMEILTKFNSALSKISSFQPEAYTNFGLNEKPIENYGIISQIERLGEWMPDPGQGLKDIKLKKGDAMQFCVSLNLGNLPEYAKDNLYLKNNLVINAKGCEVDFEVKGKDDVDKSKLKSKGQIKLFDDASHLLLFKVNELKLADASMEIKLPLHYDDWHLEWSTMDDKTQQGRNNKTFAFEHFVKGIQEAFETENKNYIDLTISLNK